MKFRRALIPKDWHDSGILAPNAAVLIAVFALRLSAGGLSVMFGRSDGQRGEEEEEEGESELSVSCQDGILMDYTGLYLNTTFFTFLLTICEWVRYS